MVLEVPLYIPLAFAVMKLRGFLTVATAGVFLVLADLVQRLVIVPLVWVAPARKERVLAAWQRWIAGNLIGMARVVEGAKFEPIPTIPSAPGVLVLMNHQPSWTSRSWFEVCRTDIHVSSPENVTLVVCPWFRECSTSTNIRSWILRAR